MEQVYSPDFHRYFDVRLDMSGPCWLWLLGKTAAGYGKATYEWRTYAAHRLAYELAYGVPPTELLVRHLCEAAYAPGDRTYRRCCHPGHLALGTHADNMRDMVRSGRVATGERHGRRLHPNSVPRGERSFSRTHPERLARGDANGTRVHPERLPRGDLHWTHVKPGCLARGDDNGARVDPEALARGDRNGSRLYPERLHRGDQHWSRRSPERRAWGDRNGMRTKPEARPQGERHGNAKLTDEQVQAIRVAHASGRSYARIAADYGVSKTCIAFIMQGRTRRRG